MRLLIIAIALLTLSQAARADEMIYREDAGLTKAEYFLANAKYTAAVEAANDVLTRHPQNADAYTYRGVAYTHLGQNKEAIKDFQRALQINPNHLGANKYLADAYLQNGKENLAVEQMEAMRVICGQSNCSELDHLQAEIDQYKMTKTK